jgi:tripartite-type tricarboxylate transporter receptor subunit TctC
VRISFPLRRIALSCALVAAACFGSATALAASDFPNKPIKLLVGFSAAGSTDTIARFYAARMSEVLKTPVIVENRAGAAQLIAIRMLMSAPPDGYTLFLASASAMSQGPGVRSDLPYDPLKDFSPIALVGTIPGVIVISPKLPIKTIGDLVAYAKQHPNTLNYGSSGVGSASHLQMEYLNSMTGTKMAHIPYKADAEIMTGIAEGSVQLGFAPLQGALPLIQAGRVRGLAVTGTHRVAAIPEVPTLAEADVPGLGVVDPYTYYALLAPIGTPAAVVDNINAAVNTVSRMPTTIQYMHERLYEPGTGTPQDMQRFVAQDLAKWRKFGASFKLEPVQ